MIVYTRYECERCGTRYKTAEEAVECETAPRIVVAQPGDIVLTGYPGHEHRHGWYNGDKTWIHDSIPGASHDGRLYSFYWVVGAVEWKMPRGSNGKIRCADKKDRGPVYHLFTRAVGRDEPDENGCNYIHSAGWTIIETHYPIRKADPQPKLVGAEEFIGRHAEHLL